MEIRRGIRSARPRLLRSDWRVGENDVTMAGLASIKWTPIQAALMVFSFCWFSNASARLPPQPQVEMPRVQ
jgi:hypothetical protein